MPLVYGVILGAVAGYFGGRSDSVIMRLVDVVIAFPFIVLVIAILAVVGPGVKGIYIAVLAVAWAMYARLTRAEMLVLREQQFMLAAEALASRADGSSSVTPFRTCSVRTSSSPWPTSSSTSSLSPRSPSSGSACDRPRVGRDGRGGTELPP